MTVNIQGSIVFIPMNLLMKSGSAIQEKHAHKEIQVSNMLYKNTPEVFGFEEVNIWQLGRCSPII